MNRNKQSGKSFSGWTLIALLMLGGGGWKRASAGGPGHFKVLVVASRAKDHLGMIGAAKPFLEKMAAENNFSLDFTDDTSTINDANLANYQVFVMLHLAPFDMSRSQQAALEKFVRQGKGWVGIHAAGLTGKQFLGHNTKYWQWFEGFMGGVTYSPHPAYQRGTLVVEDRQHPVTKGLPARFEVSDEWYEFNKSPRGNVRVLASADESTYHQNRPMGDHPLIWTNERYRRMIYIGIGHDPSLWNNENYIALVRNAIIWVHSDTSMPFLPMQNGVVSYSSDHYDVALRKEERYERALKWFTRSKANIQVNIRVADKTAGKIEGTGGFKVITSNTGNYYRIKFTISIIVTDSDYTCRTYNYYEKPIEKGITNDYSKIEYRWWDFRQGKPWSSEDQTLFKGISTGTSSLMASLDSSFTVESAVPAKKIIKDRFRALVLYENGGNHVAYSARAKTWLDQLALDSNFRIDYLTHTDSINEEYLSKYQLIIQLDYAPYAWKPAAVAAFENYIGQGRGGWVGFHHATLLGEFDGYPMWQWFYTFMGSIRWKDYIARFAKATVRVEDHYNPVMKDVPDSFVVQKEEWYTYDRSPRPNVHVLAHVDESSYSPDTTVKMGDHPVIWINERVKARNVYIFMGHSPVLFDDQVYKLIFRNAIFWAAGTNR